MTKTYRKLSDSEMIGLYDNLCRFYAHKDSDYDGLISLVKDVFGDRAVVILIEINSEYNDEGYDSSVGHISVFDSNDMEVPLSRQARQKFDTNSRKFDLMPKYSNQGYGSDEPIDDVVLYVTKSLPVIYIEEK